MSDGVVSKPENPCGLNGVEFIEYAGPDPDYFRGLFSNYGFAKVGGRQSGLTAELYRQGDINFVLNTSQSGFAGSFSKSHGPSICSTGFRVHDARKAFQTAVARGARPFVGDEKHRLAPHLQAVYGIGDSLVYFVDSAAAATLYSNEFSVPAQPSLNKGFGFTVVDHFTNNVPVGEMQKWCDFYTQVFGFHETRYFDIRGQKTGLISKVMRSPCGKFSVPINEPTDSKSQIQEYLDEYHGSGIQHLALLTGDIVQSLDQLKSRQLEFLTPPPASYYEMIPDRIPNVSENLSELQRRAILVDGDDKGYLLQIFSKNIIGPIFFEVIQRKGHSGFGEGNFQALFDAIERDQRERGYLT